MKSSSDEEMKSIFEEYDCQSSGRNRNYQTSNYTRRYQYSDYKLDRLRKEYQDRNNHSTEINDYMNDYDASLPPLVKIHHLPSNIEENNASHQDIYRIFKKVNNEIDVGHFILPFELTCGNLHLNKETIISRSMKIATNSRFVTYLDEGVLGKKDRANMEEDVENILFSGKYSYENKTSFMVWVDEYNRIQFRALCQGDSEFLLFRFNQTKNSFSIHLKSKSAYRNEYFRDPQKFDKHLQLQCKDIVVIGSSEFFLKLTDRQITLLIQLENSSPAQEIAKKLAELAVNYTNCISLFKPESKVKPNVKDISVVIMKMVSSTK